MRLSLTRDTRAQAGALVFALLPCVAPCLARAADMDAINHAARFASSAVVNSGPSVGVTLLQTIVGLVFVLALVFACAWVARRMNGQPHADAALTLVASVSLGDKERVAIVAVDNTWLVLGAAPGNVRLLHTMPARESANRNPHIGSDLDDFLAEESVLEEVTATAQGRAQRFQTFGQRFRAALLNRGYLPPRRG